MYGAQGFDFPTEFVREGMVEVLVPKLSAFVERPGDYAPSKAPVFYNPMMELNRDIAVVALQAYQRRVGRELVVCEPLAGCGVRGVRFAVEVEGISQVVMNDINPRAFELARFNVRHNQLDGRVLVFNEDANLLLSRYASPKRRFDFIDIDPFGSPAPFLDSAIRAVRRGGMLALTATDTAPLCGVHPKACLRKYGGWPLRTEYCRELAVRLLIGLLATSAAKYDIGIEVLFSHGTDHYVRTYALLHHGARRADESLQKMGYILHCFKCLHREAFRGISPPLRCPECGGPLSVAGPLWLGPLMEGDFCLLMEGEAEKKVLGRKRRVLRLLSIARSEVGAPITYYVVDEVCDMLNVSVPPLMEVVRRLREEGYQAAPTHFDGRGFKTDAPAHEVRRIIGDLASLMGRGPAP